LDRTAWVDVAKALCIILVVMMHSTLGFQRVVGQSGFLDTAVFFFAPIRIPTFFVLSGLFLGRALHHPFGQYAQARIAHFAYFYLLWLTIHVAVRAGPQMINDPLTTASQLILALVEPYEVLWFLHLLIAFSLAAYALRRVAPLAVLAAAAVLYLARFKTGSLLIDEFTTRAVFFVAGWALAPAFFALARSALAHPGISVAVIIGFAVYNAGVVFWTSAAALPAVGLTLGLGGAAAMTLLSARLAATPLVGACLAALGRQSLVVYVAFTLPMATLRIALMKTGLFTDGWLAIGIGCLVITTGAVVGPLLLERLVRGSPLRFLFQRPGASTGVRHSAKGQPLATQAVR
jgi:uncharacterized membrane protein YcfT